MLRLDEKRRGEEIKEEESGGGERNSSWDRLHSLELTELVEIN